MYHRDRQGLGRRFAAGMRFFNGPATPERAEPRERTPNWARNLVGALKRQAKASGTDVHWPWSSCTELRRHLAVGRGSSSNSATVTRRATAILRKLRIATLRSPRSTDPIKVRCKPHFSASAACVNLAASRRSWMRNPICCKNVLSFRFILDNKCPKSDDVFK